MSYISIDKLIISSLIRHNGLSEKSRFFSYFNNKNSNFIIGTLSFSNVENLSIVSKYIM